LAFGGGNGRIFSIMSSQAPDLSRAAAPSGVPAPWRARLRPGGLAMAAVLIAWLLFFVSVEVHPPYLLAAAGVFVGLTALLFGVLRRWRMAFALTAIVFLSVYVSAVFKYSIVAMNLHIYDVAFYLRSASQIEFFYDTFAAQAFGITAGAAAGVAALYALWRFEHPWSLRPLARAGIVTASIAGIAGSMQPLLRNNVDFFSDRELVFSAFLSSFRDLPQLMRMNHVFEAPTAQANATPIPLEAISCSPDGTPPDIVFFLNESAMPPGVYPNLAYPAELEPFFKSHDGKIHPMRVETFGGGTWLSDFSALTGLSTNTFGTMRNFATQIMTGRLRHSLPQYLKACGYDTTIIYPSSADFAGSKRFYQAIGFDQVIDRKVHKASDERQRDLFYYDQVLQVMEKARSSGNRRPQFIAASSMSTHMPWDFRYAPDQVRKGENLRWTGDKEFDEYLWRLVLAKRDRDTFRERLAERFPREPFLFVSYGDHQPALQKIPVDNPVAIAEGGTSWQLDPTARAFQTYFSIEALHFTPKATLPDFPVLEIPHLATVTVQAAGLPLDKVFRQRVQLMKTCEGLFGSCADRGALLTFQHWMAEAGWVTAQK
jgi:hypothetical protein